MDSRDRGGPVHAGQIIASRFFSRAMYVGMRLLEHIRERSESPIEEMLALHLLLLDVGLDESSVVFGGMPYGDLRFPDAKNIDDCIEAISDIPKERAIETVVFQQVNIGPYRVDFVIGKIRQDSYKPEETLGLPKTSLVVVECDGHSFHEKTKEQASRDKARDRYIQTLGVPILRFTGSELWNRPSDCIDQIDNLLCRATGQPEVGGTSQDLKQIEECPWDATKLAGFFDSIEDYTRRRRQSGGPKLKIAEPLS